MATRATKGNAYDLAKSLCADLKAGANNLNTSSAAGPISANVLREFFIFLLSCKTQLNTIIAIPGINDYVKLQEGDPNYQFVTESTTTITEVSDTIDWIIANMPVGGAGNYVLVEQWSSSGIVTRNFSSAQTAGLRTQLTALIATID